MNREYHKAYSQELHRDMEALVFGHAGMPLLVFPTSMGKFFEYEDRGMIGVLAPKIERGELQVFCPDGVDNESWYNKGVHPRVRALRHLQYERYILHEFLPFFRWKNQAWQLAATGCSFGGYQAASSVRFISSTFSVFKSTGRTRKASRKCCGRRFSSLFGEGCSISFRPTRKRLRDGTYSLKSMPLETMSKALARTMG